MGETFWWLAPALSAVTIGIIVWVNWIRPYRREQNLRRPFSVLLIRPPGQSEADMVNELTAPPHSEFSIQLRITPHLTFELYDVVFGFLGHPECRPVPLKGFNEFIKTGKRRERSPENDDNHYIDENDNYHIRETRSLVKPNPYRYGYLVRTREPGDYPIRLEIVTESGEALPINGVFLRVGA